MSLKVITVDQPYASLIMAGVKRWETRPSPLNGNMRPEGVRGLPGLKVNAGERIGIAASKKWAKGWCRWYDPDHSTVDSDLMEVLGSIGVDFAEDCNGSYQWKLLSHWSGLPLGALLGTVEVPRVMPVVSEWSDLPAGWDESSPFIVAVKVAGRLAVWNPESAVPQGFVTVDISDQLPFGHWAPGGWAWELADPQPLAEPIPAKGKQGVWEWKEGTRG